MKKKEIIEMLCKLYQDYLDECRVYGGASFWGMKKVKELSSKLKLTHQGGKNDSKK